MAIRKDHRLLQWFVLFFFFKEMRKICVNNKKGFSGGKRLRIKGEKSNCDKRLDLSIGGAY